MNWSPEPWFTHSGTHIGNDPDGFSGELLHPIANSFRKEDAERIIACVNALKGIPTKFIESGSIKRLLDELLCAPVTITVDYPQKQKLADVMEILLNRIRELRRDEQL